MAIQISKDSPASSNPRNPIQSIRKFVGKACIHCKASHVACENKRPCEKCIKRGRQDTCVDAETKKRGRPPKNESQCQECFSARCSCRKLTSVKKKRESLKKADRWTPVLKSGEPLLPMPFSDTIFDPADFNAQDMFKFCPDPVSPSASTPSLTADDPKIYTMEDIFDGSIMANYSESMYMEPQSHTWIVSRSKSRIPENDTFLDLFGDEQMQHSYDTLETPIPDFDGDIMHDLQEADFKNNYGLDVDPTELEKCFSFLE